MKKEYASMELDMWSVVIHNTYQKVLASLFY